MSSDQISAPRYSVHGLPLRLQCDVDWLRPPLAHVFDEFRVDGDSTDAEVIDGTICSYRETDANRIISASATRMGWRHESIELYEDGERFFLIDDRWGIAEMNLRKGHWQSWMVPQPLIDPIRCAEFGVLWPLAQLARARNLHFLPATSLTRGDHTLMVFSPFSIEPELCELMRAGYRIIGQSWTVIREDTRGITLLYLPGQVERNVSQMGIAGQARPTWVDLMDPYARDQAPKGFCDTILLIDPARRSSAYLRPITPQRAAEALRAAWPTPQLHPHRRHGQLPLRLAQRCACYQTCLPRRCSDFPKLLEALDARHTSVKRPDPATFSISRRIAG